MTRDSIISEITSDSSYLEYCLHIYKGRDIHKDLYQFIILTLLEMPESKLIDLSKDKGRLNGYIKRMIFFNATSKTAPFYRQYRDRDYIEYTSEFVDIIDDDPNQKHAIDLIGDILKDKSNGMGEYGVDLLKEYAEAGSYRKLEKKIGINYCSIRYIVKDLINQIHEDFNNNYG